MSKAVAAAPAPVEVTVYAKADVPTRFGVFKVVVFRNNQDDKEHVALVVGDPAAASADTGVLCRIHSECMTGDVFGSLKCDCGPQFERACRAIQQEGAGVILYMRQEGRGIGLGNKIRAYALQQQGLDTVDANRALGFPDDMRRYDIAAEMLRALGAERIRLMTNNPRKVNELRNQGIDVVERVSHVVTAQEHNVHYLRTKRERSGHFFDELDLRGAAGK